MTLFDLDIASAAFGGLIVCLAYYLKTRVGIGLDWLVTKFFSFLSGTALYAKIDFRSYRVALNKEIRSIFTMPANLAHHIDIQRRVSYSSKDSILETASAITFINQTARLFLVGTAGLGKSTICREILTAFCANQTKTKRPSHLPVYVNCFDLQVSGFGLRDYIERKLFVRLQIGNPERFFLRLLSKGRVHFLIDGLDEIDRSVRHELLQTLEDLANISEGNIVTVFTRPHGFKSIYRAPRHAEYARQDDERSYKLCTLEPLSGFDRQRLYAAYFDNIPISQRIPPENIFRIRDRQCLENPLLYSLLLRQVGVDDRREAVFTKLSFYLAATELMLNSWHDHLNRFRRDQKQEVLEIAARQIVQQFANATEDLSVLEKQTVLSNKKNGKDEVLARRLADSRRKLSLSRRIMQSVLTRRIREEAKLIQPDDSTAILTEVVERSGLLILDESEEDSSVRTNVFYSFSMQSFQDFFIAASFDHAPLELMNQVKDRVAQFSDAFAVLSTLLSDSSEFAKECKKYDLATAVRIAANAKTIQQSTLWSLLSSAVKELKNDPDRLGVSSSLAELAGSNCFGSETRDVLMLLIRKIDTPKLRLALSLVLARSHHFEAAHFFGQRIKRSKLARIALREMEDMAIPFLIENLGETDLLVIELSMIRSFTSIAKIAQLVNSENRSVSILAALCIATVMFKDTYLEWIKSADVSSEPHDYSWVCSDHAPNPNLVATIGRVFGKLANAKDRSRLAEIPDLKFELNFAVPFLCICVPEDARSAILESGGGAGLNGQVISTIYRGLAVEDQATVIRFLRHKGKLTKEQWQRRKDPPKLRFENSSFARYASKCALLILCSSIFAGIYYLVLDPISGIWVLGSILLVFAFSSELREDGPIGIPRILWPFTDLFASCRTRAGSKIGVCTLIINPSMFRIVFSGLEFVFYLTMIPSINVILLQQFCNGATAICLVTAFFLTFASLICVGILREVRSQNPFSGL